MEHEQQVVVPSFEMLTVSCLKDCVESSINFPMLLCICRFEVVQ